MSEGLWLQATHARAGTSLRNHGGMMEGRRAEAREWEERRSCKCF